MKVCLDAGHGMNTAGKRTPPYPDGTQIREAEQNYAVMELVKKYLEHNGVEVVVTNSDKNKDMPLSERVEKANKSGADLFVSIHKNAYTGTWQDKAKGIETFVYKKGGKAEKYANNVQKELVADTKMNDRGVKEGNLYVLRKTKMPAILVELGFMDYKPEADQMRDKEWHKKYAKAIVKGIMKAQGKEAKFPDESEKKSWEQQMGIDAVMGLYELGYIYDPTYWTSQNMLEPIPMWAAFETMHRLARDIYLLRSHIIDLENKR